MKTVLKTDTICDNDDNPFAVLCEGHVNSKTFLEAYNNEWGKDNENYIPESGLRYEYWIKGKKFWKKSEPGKKGVIPFTACDWD